MCNLLKPHYNMLFQLFALRGPGDSLDHDRPVLSCMILESDFVVSHRNGRDKNILSDCKKTGDDLIKGLGQGLPHEILKFGRGFPLGLPLKCGFGTSGPIWVKPGTSRGVQSWEARLIYVVDGTSLENRLV